MTIEPCASGATAIGFAALSSLTYAVDLAVLGVAHTVLDLPEGAVTHEVEAFATAALEGHVERRLRSLRLLHD